MPFPSIDEFDYDLPTAAIAQAPAEPRDSARLLVDRGPAAESEHRRFSDLVEFLGPGDLLVVNDTKVIPARLRLQKPTGAAVEVLLLEPIGLALAASGDEAVIEAASKAASSWAALVRPSRRIKDGTELIAAPLIAAPAGAPTGQATPPPPTLSPAAPSQPQLRVTVGARITDRATGADTGQREVEVRLGDQLIATPAQAAELLADFGEAPLPPYIDSPEPAAQPLVRKRYQTVYARQPGSVAAPTAGLHFTPELFEAIAAKGVEVASVDLVVGLDTFRPVSGELADHVMHTERYEVSGETWRRCQEAQRVVAVGTTTVRALESAARAAADLPSPSDPPPRGYAGRTDLFLKRGDEFKMVDALITNFHLPRSTLLVLIDAFIGARWRALYETALVNGYRFLSFGDAMLLTRSP